MNLKVNKINTSILTPLLLCTDPFVYYLKKYNYSEMISPINYEFKIVGFCQNIKHRKKLLVFKNIYMFNDSVTPNRFRLRFFKKNKFSVERLIPPEWSSLY